MIKLDQVIPNPTNPRILKEDKFEKLVNSIIEFPQMMKMRPIVIDEDFIALGGNMRDRAIVAIRDKGKAEVAAYLTRLGKKENLKILDPVFKGYFPEGWVYKAEELSKHQKKEFIIKDNVSFGEWDWNELANNWDVEEMNDWGLTLPIMNSGAKVEFNIDDEHKTLKLKYTDAEYNLIKEKLSKIADTPEEAVWLLVNNEL